MIEQNAVAGVEAVGFAIVDGDPVGIELGDGIGRAGMEGGGFLLWNFLDHPVQFGGGGLVEAGFPLQPEDADGLDSRSVPRASVLAVYSGILKETATWLCAARL